MTREPRNIAIVGCGPKGMYALDALCLAAQDTPSQMFDVHIFEPSPHPGAGPIYDPGQSEILLMNFPAKFIDAWTDGRGPDLQAWLKVRDMAVASGAYVPRALVGRYLTWCFEKAVADAPSNIRLKIHPRRVTGLCQSKNGWEISPGNVAADEVLVTTGHQDWSRRGQTENPFAIPSPFLVDRVLSEAAIPPGTTVACKGFALTFLDTMLALTEGRGGVFTETGQGYRYRPSGTEPRLIAPFSRTGRPMRPKVEEGHFVPPQDNTFWENQVADFDVTLKETPGATFRDDVWPALLRSADRTLDQPPGRAAAFFDDWQGCAFGPIRCREELRKGYAVALGLTAPDIGWALGEAWRHCYPQIVRWVSHRALGPKDAACFRHIAAEMERLAFGPPAQNVGKLICLEKAGLVSFDHLGGDAGAEITIDATIPPAGSADLSQPLAGLLRDGHLSVGALGGIVVNTRAQALVDSVPVPGLSIIGRATEGSVLGNDTLSRGLHDLPERWAERVVSPATVSTHRKLEHIA